MSPLASPMFPEAGTRMSAATTAGESVTEDPPGLKLDSPGMDMGQAAYQGGGLNDTRVVKQPAEW